uniref:Protein phosphatase Slingshot homolog 3 (Trinotate prediction) n=1 Tax=Henneguya salminicola TaxID=69463 RepID=A0A6G3MGC9_HENSL
MILNVTSEINNFFPGVFEYYNICVLDRPEVEIINYFDEAYRFIEKARFIKNILTIRINNTSVLVHCQMGISRSATIIISYLMKYYEWDAQLSLEFVKSRRPIVKPNCGFLKQIYLYEAILTSSRNRNIFNSMISKISHTRVLSDNSLNTQNIVIDKINSFKSEGKKEIRTDNSLFYQDRSLKVSSSFYDLKSLK